MPREEPALAYEISWRDAPDCERPIIETICLACASDTLSMTYTGRPMGEPVAREDLTPGQKCPHCEEPLDPDGDATRIRNAEADAEGSLATAYDAALTATTALVKVLTIYRAAGHPDADRIDAITSEADNLASRIRDSYEACEVCGAFAAPGSRRGGRACAADLAPCGGDCDGSCGGGAHDGSNPAWAASHGGAR